MSFLIRRRAALNAAAFHFLVSLIIASIAAAFVFGFWYPYPYRNLVGGLELFLIVVAVDVVCGPLLTLLLFNPSKSRRELLLDLSLIVLLQLSAFGYGVYSLAMARPVYMVFEVDRFRVVTVADIQLPGLKKVESGIPVLSWKSPKIIGVRDPIGPDEKLNSLELSLQGIEPSSRPDWWQSYDLSKSQVVKRAKPIEVLRKKQPSAASLISQAIADSGKLEADLGWVPLTSFKTTNWVAIVDIRSAEVLGFAPVDGF